MPVIVGPTGSGKTGVSIEIAKEVMLSRLFDRVEIISADSRAIYEGMDIGTAKPSMLERRGVAHYGFDLVRPDERFTVVDYKNYAEQRITEIENRGGLPIIVGGTGLYVDAVVYNYQFTQEAKKKCSDRKKMSTKFIVFGIDWGRTELKERLKERMNKIFVQELFDETERLAKEFSWDLPAMTSNVYKIAWEYMKGKLGLEEAKELAWLEDVKLARRQMTWFRRNSEIKWCKLAETKDVVLKCIQDEQRK